MIGNGHKTGAAVSNGDNGMRFPFSPMNNNSATLRQRRKPSEKGLLPPTSSLTEGSFYNNEPTSEVSATCLRRVSTDTTTLDRKAHIIHKGMENKPTENHMVLWNGNANSKSQESWEFWVLVYGFSSKAQYDEVIHRFESFGRIVSQRSSGSNWVSLRYESYLEAEKALCQQTCILSEGAVVGVSRMDAKLSQTLDWNATPTDVHTTRESKSMASVLGEDDVLMSEKRAIGGTKSSVCEKFLTFIFGWD